MDRRDQYQKACDIADVLLSRGFPVTSYESIDDQIIIRFHGPRAQTIHADAATASFESFRDAYQRGPP